MSKFNNSGSSRNVTATIKGGAMGSKNSDAYLDIARPLVLKVQPID